MLGTQKIVLLFTITLSACQSEINDGAPENNMNGVNIKKYSETIRLSQWMKDNCKKSEIIMDSIYNTAHFKSKIILSACLETMADTRLNLRVNDSFDIVSSGVFCSIFTTTGKYKMNNDTIWLHGKIKFNKLFNDGEKLIIIDDSADYSNGPYYLIGDCKGLN